ncbi:MAG: hypothetical protein BECKG1743D_GA0114223_106531, partial [Candidatus Kentron sp. G]
MRTGLKTLLAQLGIAQAQFGRELDLSPTSVSLFLAGKRRPETRPDFDREIVDLLKRKGATEKQASAWLPKDDEKKTLEKCYGSRYFGGSVPHTGRGNRGTSRQPDSAHGQRIL